MRASGEGLTNLDLRRKGRAWDLLFLFLRRPTALVGAILGPVGGFGKFLLVLLALSTPSACAPTLYTVCTSFMTISSVFAKIPRAIIAIVSTAM